MTGAATGIGAAITERLAGQGMDVVLVARDGARLEAAAERLRAERGVQVSTLALDLSHPGAPFRLAEWLAGAGTEVDVLVNNAGVDMLGPVAGSDPVRVRGLVDLNAGAVAELTALLLPAMVARGRGAIVNIASTGAYAPAPYMAAYAASKAFVLSFTQAVWAETRETGVRVVAVSPGPYRHRDEHAAHARKARARFRRGHRDVRPARPRPRGRRRPSQHPPDLRLQPPADRVGGCPGRGAGPARGGARGLSFRDRPVAPGPPAGLSRRSHRSRSRSRSRRAGRVRLPRGEERDGGGGLFVGQGLGTGRAPR
ncbi:SDR family NAD(P)-dependent oxidoreductase [Streptomyces sp. NRRL F-5126]|uniref:SDR family NAD(P)-dependent oxidoreductase n=1 Tax=Streptomyces sp. NRRL F-5126 TaxID=1463857 RepID=UPI0018FEC564|nr:SDR family NAD(P)-dependent oxidoreductase [Streptomyces sp. NRRL F-5126]